MDVLAREAAHHPTVLVLTWSVDYWNYLGWTDTFARQEYSARQARYADKLGARGPYTPMLVINGSSQIKGNKKSLVCKAFEALEASVAPATAQPSDGVEIRAELVEFKPGETRFHPGNGPNRGEEMVYTNLVLSTQDVTLDSDGQSRTDCQSNCLLIVSEEATGTVVRVSYLEADG